MYTTYIVCYRHNDSQKKTWNRQQEVIDKTAINKTTIFSTIWIEDTEICLMRASYLLKEKTVPKDN